MEDSKALIGDLINHLDNKEIVKTIEQINTKIKSEALNHQNSKEVLNDALVLLSRKNKQVESEVQQLVMVQSRNNEMYNKKNSERLKLAKKIIDLEQKNEEIDGQIAELEFLISQKDDDLRKISQPSAEELFYEIVKGFGVDFTRRNNKLIAKIRNKNKNDLFEVEVSDSDPKATCDTIWSLME